MLKTIFLKEQTISLTRQFFHRRHFIELDPPVLVNHPPLESTLTAFEIKNNNLFLSTSPEIEIKKTLAVTPGNYFSISHCFRALESASPWHTSEFLMLEWYQLNSTYLDVINTTKQFIRFIAKRPTPTSSRTLKNLFKTYANLNLDQLLLDNISEADFNQIFLNKIEPRLPKNKLFFILNYPTRFSYFATPLVDNELYCQRFEAYLAGVEIANGNTEDTQSPFPIPPCAGCGLGLDRLSLIFAKSPSFAL